MHVGLTVMESSVMYSLSITDLQTVSAPLEAGNTLNW